MPLRQAVTGFTRTIPERNGEMPFRQVVTGVSPGSIPEHNLCLLPAHLCTKLQRLFLATVNSCHKWNYDGLLQSINGCQFMSQVELRRPITKHKWVSIHVTSGITTAYYKALMGVNSCHKWNYDGLLQSINGCSPTVDSNHKWNNGGNRVRV
jgi:hypothetical protein